MTRKGLSRQHLDDIGRTTAEPLVTLRTRISATLLYRHEFTD
ncbi:hypothetical protein [Tamaricihabitans halophyticus]|nr:hypothetical protein [Tamaricihabitans halophyticus]